MPGSAITDNTSTVQVGSNRADNAGFGAGLMSALLPPTYQYRAPFGSFSCDIAGFGTEPMSGLKPPTYE